jgi:hypothetical protein
MQVSQLAIKLFAADPGAVALDVFPPIFHRWIQEHRIPGLLLIDVADYRHVVDGPGIVLIANEAHIAIDGERGPLGLLYSVKRDAPGELADKLDQAFRAALTAARALEEDPARPIRFRADRIRVAIMSRRLAPNSGETFAAARPALEALGGRIHPGRQPAVEQVTDPRGPFAVDIAVAGPLALAELPAL